MRAVASSRGAATIVNAIATGKGAAFGITLQTDVTVDLERGDEGISLDGPREGAGLVSGCVSRIALNAGVASVSGRVVVRSDIPVSRGLKSSSAASNAVVLATARAFGVEMTDHELVLAGVEESLRAGVTITGAYDDACACFLGGVALTDNGAFKLLKRDTMDPDLVVLIHVPEGRTTKASLKGIDFSPIRNQVEWAFELAERGQYLRALEANSKAYARLLPWDESVASAASSAGALAAGMSGTGPATVAVCGRGEAGSVRKAMGRFEGRVIDAHVNDTSAREVAPRLL